MRTLRETLAILIATCNVQVWENIPLTFAFSQMFIVTVQWHKIVTSLFQSTKFQSMKMLKKKKTRGFQVFAKSLANIDTKRIRWRDPQHLFEILFYEELSHGKSLIWISSSEFVRVFQTKKKRQKKPILYVTILLDRVKRRPLAIDPF